MRLEKIILILIIVFLTLSVAIPFVIFYTVKDKSVAAQIGDTFGGTTAPLINISAILAVIATYLYQRRNDQRNNAKEQIVDSFKNLKEELQKIDYSVTTTNKTTGKVIRSDKGADAIHQMIRSLNNEEYSIDTFRELAPYKSIVNIYEYLNLLLSDINNNSNLNPNDKKMLLTQLSLFYRNNLLIDKEQRGDEICKFHKKKHKIPNEIYYQLIQIESKIK